LRHAFNIEVGSETWNELERQFGEAFRAVEKVSAAPRRTQDRNKKGVRPLFSAEVSANVLTEGIQKRGLTPFFNEPDTDWSLPQNSRWAEGVLESWRPRCGQSAVDVPLVTGGREITDGRPLRESLDPSRPGVVVARYRQATEADIEEAVATGGADADGWRTRSASERTRILHAAAGEIAAARGELVGAMLAEGGKTLSEGDPEVSEAIDFCRFYSTTAEYFYGLDQLAARGQGVVVVVSPWNFPLAIPCGGVTAALAAGNNVILKPASDTVLIAYLMCQCLWRAGVPKSALQFAPCSGGTVGERLVTHDGVDAVVLTGGTATAARMLSAKPTMNLLAETGGKNATIVTALSDRDQAIKNVLHSAFSHSGQKCSATSLLILESEVYHDPKFREQFCDAVGSLTVGSAWELPTKTGPLIRPPGGALETGLKELEPGEEWAVMPRLHVDDNPNLVSPGVKWGVQPNSFTHCTELFGPVLGVMDARDLDHAIELVNATGYGLTSGLESLDDREHQSWRDRIRAGNLYINRPTTGAIVLRQPFGGTGKSSVGPGIKAGGPNYVVPLMRFESDQRAVIGGRGAHACDQRSPHMEPDLEAFYCAVGNQFPAHEILAAIESYAHWAGEEFHVAHDHFRLLGEDNFRQYLPVEPLRIRVHPADTLFDVFARAVAARAAGCRSTVSIPFELMGPAGDAVELLDHLTDSWAGAIEFVEEDDERLAELIRSSRVARIRYAAPDRVPDTIRRAAADALQYVADTPVSAHGRVELLWYVREQSIAHLYHRHGNLGIRAEERRAEPT
jgi:RHH-type proline utilization regulon transcriptional repressor/proline dehydrogenase/delta 1-pyrroline-5-carboxylate dehydrogenase